MLGVKEMHLSGTFQNQGNALLDHADTSSKDEEQSSSFGRATAEGRRWCQSYGAPNRGSAQRLCSILVVRSPLTQYCNRDELLGEH